MTKDTEALREALKDLARGVFIDAATITHHSWVDGTNGREPDFDEYAGDYAESFADAYVDNITAALATPASDVVAGGEALREGPAPIPNTRMQCFGCKHLHTEDWREPSGDGETFDSGTSACCNAVPTEHGGQSIGAYWSRTNDAPKWCPFLAALKGPAA